MRMDDVDPSSTLMIDTGGSSTTDDIEGHRVVMRARVSLEIDWCIVDGGIYPAVSSSL